MFHVEQQDNPSLLKGRVFVCRVLLGELSSLSLRFIVFKSFV